MLQQLAAGSLNIAQAATDQSLRAILRGAPIRIVAGATASAPFRLIAAKTVRSWSDLKRKTISVGGLNGCINVSDTGEGRDGAKGFLVKGRHSRTDFRQNGGLEEKPLSGATRQQPRAARRSA